MKRPLLTLCFALAAAASVIPPARTAPRAAAAPPPVAARLQECEGNACRVVTLVWDHAKKQYCSQNNSDKWVKVEVTAASGAVSVRIAPGGSDCLAVQSFEGPYRANYD